MKKIIRPLFLISLILVMLTACAQKVSLTITEAELQEEADKVIAQYERQGQPIPEDQIPVMKNALLEQLIERKVLLLAIERDEYSIPVDMVQAQIDSFKSGFETDEKFQEALTEMDYTEESFTTMITEMMTIDQFVSEKTADAAEVTDEDIKTFYDENPQYFTQGESVTASHILIKVEPTATSEEKADALNRITAIAQKIKDGADFAEMAKEFSEGPSGPNGGDLGSFGRGQMVGPFEAAAFALNVGEVSDAVETQFGFHLIKLFAKQDGATQPLEEVTEMIRPYLAEQKAEEARLEFIQTEMDKVEVTAPNLEDSTETEAAQS